MKRWYPFNGQSLLLSSNHDDDVLHKIICFPYAGGHSGQFFPWLEFIPVHMQLCAVELPGRATRFHEPLIKDIDELVTLLLPEIREMLGHSSFSVFGHSMGARLAFELAARLEAEHNTPADYIFVSAAQPPCFENHIRLHELPDEELLTFLAEHHHVDLSFLTNPKDKDEFLKIMRADCYATANYKPKYVNVNSPIVCFNGQQDNSVDSDDALLWSNYTTNTFELISIPGSHLYINSEYSEIIKQIFSRIKLNNG